MPLLPQSPTKNISVSLGEGPSLAIFIEITGTVFWGHCPHKTIFYLHSGYFAILISVGSLNLSLPKEKTSIINSL